MTGEDRYEEEVSGRVDIVCGEASQVMAALPSNFFHALVTDPPYDLLQASRRGSGRSNNPNTPAGRHGDAPGGFMGMKWDATGVAFKVETWEACLRVLKPGGHLVVFGGTRTHHRMWCAIEDAGFEVRDMLMWLYGSGFPKSLDVSKAIDKAAGAERKVVREGFTSTQDDQTVYQRGLNANFQQRQLTAPTTDDAVRWSGWGTALKPAWEPIILARKPLSEKTVAANVLRWGTGGLNIDGSRVEIAKGDDKAWRTGDYKTEGAYFGGSTGKNYRKDRPTGRWPANVVLECVCSDPQPVPEKTRERHEEPSQEQRYTEKGATNLAAKPGIRREGGGIIHTNPECSAALLDEQSGERRSPQPYIRRGGSASKQVYGEYEPREGEVNASYGDSGGASRFFYCAKASRAEREAGLDGLPLRPGGSTAKGYTEDVARGVDRNRPVANDHPTVKPVALMRWLVRLVTPLDGVVLDPFMGSGTTLVACREEGFGGFGIDMDFRYCQIARRRAAAVGGEGEIGKLAEGAAVEGQPEQEPTSAPALAVEPIVVVEEEIIEW